MSYMNLNIYMIIHLNIFKIYTVCVYFLFFFKHAVHIGADSVYVFIYIINIHSTHIYYVNKKVYFGCD